MSDIAILIVDDEVDVRDMLKRILRATNYRILEARDGNEALEMIKKQKPDLITLDIMMPGKDGIAVCKELKADPLTKNIPIIILTAAGNKKRVMDAGADAFMNKLLSMDELVATINRFIPSKRA